MKQLLFLLLFPCLAMAQYPGNAGQKITLGEQTTADGLVWRGRTSDTVNLMTNKIDTSAYLVLDTITEAIWLYRVSTTPKWNRVVDSLNNLQGQLSLTTKVTGVLPVANGGTGENMSGLPNNYLIRKNSSGVFDTASIFETGGNVSIGKNNPAATLEVARGSLGEYLRVGGDNASNTRGLSFTSSTTTSNGDSHTLSALSGNGVIAIATNFSERLRISSAGNVGIGTNSPAVQLHTTGAVRFATFAGGGTTTLSVDNTGNLARTSSIELKKDVTPINYGLNEILQINPINFNWIDEDKFGNENENGFIAEDVMSVIPNVVAADAHGLFMDYTKLIPILTKAIQEQTIIIKQLEDRILTLENK